MLSRFSGCEQASCYKRQCLPRFWFRRWNNQDLGLSTLESERMSLLSLLIACLQLTAHATSQLTYTQGGRITGLTVCDSSHSVASASDKGLQFSLCCLCFELYSSFVAALA